MARVFTDGGAMKLISGSQRLTGDVNFSVAFWMFRTATPVANRAVITAADVTNPAGWIVRLTTTNLIGAAFPLTVTDKERASTTAPTLNTWMHVIVTHLNTGTASTDFLFYFNGKQEAGTSVATGSGTHDTATACAIEVGTSTADATLAAPAQIGQVAIWNRAISPAEALALATGMHPTRLPEGLIEFFGMENAQYEEGSIQKLFLVAGATIPTNAAVNPPVEALPRPRRKTRNLGRFLPSSTIHPSISCRSQAVKRSAYF
jgi:hypothetical protein